MQATQPIVQKLLQQIDALLLYQSVFDGAVGQTFLTLLRSLQPDPRDPNTCLRAYGQWFRAIAPTQQSWSDYLLTQILQADNPFTQQAQQTQTIAPDLLAAARHDLQILQQVYQCNATILCDWMKDATGHSVIPWQPESPIVEPAIAETDWSNALDPFITHYRTHGTGLFAQYRAFRWQASQLVGIATPDPVKLQNLVGYDDPKAQVIKNTEFLLHGYPALHVLLYGSRGSGKSSLVKGLLSEYGDRGLRLIEVAKSELADLPHIVDRLRDAPQKFILFVDDLSFEEDEADYKALKVVLEGNLTARPANIVVYATSNRRHLIREFFSDRPRPKDSDEIHHWDTVQEKLSFSDRFGLTLTFEPANQDTYLAIVQHLATQADIKLSLEDLNFRALQWSTRHNGRSGRTARQFIDFLQSDLALNSPNS